MLRTMVSYWLGARDPDPFDPCLMGQSPYDWEVSNDGGITWREPVNTWQSVLDWMAKHDLTHSAQIVGGRNDSQFYEAHVVVRFTKEVA